MNALVGAGTSACLRTLLSINVGSYLGLTKSQALIFNTLDMAIGTFDSHFFAGRAHRDNVGQAFVGGRVFGLICAATITTVATGPVSLVLLATISVVSQIAGLYANMSLPKESYLMVV